MKECLANRIPFPSETLAKLSRGERLICLDIQGAEETNEGGENDENDGAEQEALIREVTELKLAASNSETPLAVLCFVCMADQKDEQGILCDNSPESHFQCNFCLTYWTKVLNMQQQENAEQFQKRHGQIRCMADGCKSTQYSRAFLCSHITEPEVLESYLNGLQHLETLKLYAEYQEKLLSVTREIREELLSDRESSEYSQIPSSSSTSSSTSSSVDKSSVNNPDTKASRVELAQLAETLRLQMPDARQCSQCGFGPITHSACDDLISHHNEGDSTV